MLKCIRMYVWLALVVVSVPCYAAGNYQNFKVSVYATARDVSQMADVNWLEARWNEISGQIKIDKIYLETFRDVTLVDKETIAKARKFFEDRGVEVAGGITYTIAESNRFKTFCYTNPEERAKAREVAEYTARLFDEVILDDFFFTNCKCESCIKARGDKSWSQFRLGLMKGVAEELVVGPAKKVNPKVKMVIKYPNWYEHFQGCGFNLEAEPKIFDGIYTGTETRDPVYTDQHLQQYESYLIFRYFENIAPGRNGGGWVDTGAIQYMDRYAEQLWLTLFSKAPELTLFNFSRLLKPIPAEYRAKWQGRKTSFDFSTMMKPVKQADGTSVKPTTMARPAGYAIEQVDVFLGKLGKPIGIKSYKPYHSTGEDFLHNYIGMCGIPMDLMPEFPSEANMIFLTESAKFDSAIVDKIKGHLMAGKPVMITSGLLRALQGKGIEDIVELQCTGEKAVTKKFWRRRDVWSGSGSTYESKSEIVIPEIKYLTNDSWEEISCLASGIGYPILHSADYAKSRLYVLTIPDNFGDLYNLPAEVLTQIREVLTQDLYVRVDGPSQVALFVYDNDTFIVESFLPETVNVKIVTDKRISKLRDVLSSKELAGKVLIAPPVRGQTPGSDKTAFDVKIKPHSYRVFQCE
ncbi:MAG: hypothetical protein PHY02_05670 [Phycisphaerae bacterium]|nr:hypothetical protein [Phycisphaerae bacterium]